MDNTLGTKDFVNDTLIIDRLPKPPVNKLSMDVPKSFDEYLSLGDWRVKENSNTTFCFGSLNKYIIGKATALYWENIYNEIDTNIMLGHRSGDFHIHDLGSFSSYCFGASLKDVLVKGVQGVDNISSSLPAKRLRSLCAQMSNVVTLYQNEVAGAVAFSSMNIYFAPFVYFDALRRRGIPDSEQKLDIEYNNNDMDDVLQSIESMIYQLNSNSRLGAEPAFTNITLDFDVPRPMQEMPVIIGGEAHPSLTYASFQKESELVIHAFTKILSKGDAQNKPFAYPIPTFNIGKKMDWDKWDDVFELAGKNGAPYFGNFVQGDLNEDDVYSMCPLTGDTKIPVCLDGDHGTYEIKELYEMSLKETPIEAFVPKTGWKKAKVNRMPMTAVYEVVLENGITTSMGENHLQPVKGDKTLSAKELKVGMSLPIFYFEGIRHAKIKTIEIKENTDEYLYCLEVDDEGHLFTLANGLITHNCRLRLDLRELRKKTGGLFGAGEKTGSCGVFTINLPAIAHRSQQNKELFLRDLDKQMELGYKHLLKKREVITEYYNKGLYPALKFYLGDRGFDTMFNTIGFVGGHETCLNFLHEGIETTAGKSFMSEVIHYMRDKLLNFQERSGKLFNLEYTPAESTAYRLAMLDQKRYTNIITSGIVSKPYYTNSTHLPVSIDWNLNKICEHQHGLLSLATGGSVLHCYLKESVTKETAKHFVRKMFENYDIPYMSLSPVYSICDDHGFIVGKKEECPDCGKKPATYQRVTGYCRRTDKYCAGKEQEFVERKQHNCDA